MELILKQTPPAREDGGKITALAQVKLFLLPALAD